jgi:hypothetical protein
LEAAAVVVVVVVDAAAAAVVVAAAAIAVVVATVVAAVAAPQGSEFCVGAYDPEGTDRFWAESGANKVNYWVDSKKQNKTELSYLLTRRGAIPFRATLLLHG